MAPAEALMTAEEFGRRPDPGHPEELMQGKVSKMTPPDRRKAEVCLKVGRCLGNWVEEWDLGRVLTNDPGVMTSRNPDSVRRADVVYYSYTRLRWRTLPTRSGPEIPDLIVEVRS
jgi:Uma2 family endonuclease